MRNSKLKQQSHKGRNVRRNVARKITAAAIGGTLMLYPLAVLPGWAIYGTAAAAQTEAVVKAPQLHQTGEHILTSGAVRKTYTYVTPENGKNVTALVHAIEVDLTNPYVSVNAMLGKNGTLPGRATVSAMTKETGAVAGINADYFNTSSDEPLPFGAHISQGELIKTPRQLQGMYMFGITADRVPVIDRFTVDGSVTSATGASFPIAGVNEASYRTEPDNSPSHYNALYLYTSDWTAAERPNTKTSGATPTEVLVQGGVVIQVAEGQTLPIQPPEDGYILRAHGDAAKFVAANLTPGTVVNAEYRLKSVTSGKSYAPSDWSTMVGGHTILVNDGAPSSFSRSVNSISPSSDRARTAVGYSKDQKKVYLVTVEDSANSAGVTLKELQQILVLLGVWKGVNLDGGGSTTMIERPLGEFTTQLAHPTEDGNTGTYQRPVVNGIGVYTTAPQGALKGILPSGKQVLFMGEQTEYKLKAYDTYYNPLDPAGIQAVWSLDRQELGQFSGSIFTAAAPGTGKVIVKAGEQTKELPVEVVGESQIVDLTVAANRLSLAAGTEIKTTTKAKLADGRTLTVPAGSMNWEFRGFTASVQGDTIRIDAVKSGAVIGYAIARYDGYSTLLTLTAGSTVKPFEDFEKVTYGIEASVIPADVTANVRLVTGLAGREKSKVLQLDYDFSTSAEDRTKAAYAVLNGKGAALPGTPVGLSVDVLGDNSRNMLRITVTDAAGKDHLIDLAKAIDWTGWKTVQADLSAYPLTYPVKLKSLYVASPKEGQDERALAGQLAFDNIMLLEPVQLPKEGKGTVVLTIGSKSAKIGDQKVAIDVAPIIQDGVTYLPLRFIADALGGSAEWEAAQKKVTVLRGDKLLEMKFGHDTFLVNGQRKTAVTQPIMKNGRTLVPIRLVSEQLGLQVDWDGKTKSVTIR